MEPDRRTGSEQVLGLLEVLLLPLGQPSKLWCGHAEYRHKIVVGKVPLLHRGVHIVRPSVALQLLVLILRLGGVCIRGAVLAALFADVVGIPRAVTDVRGVNLPFAVTLLLHGGRRCGSSLALKNALASLEPVDLGGAVVDVGNIHLLPLPVVTLGRRSSWQAHSGLRAWVPALGLSPARLQTVGVRRAPVDVGGVNIPLDRARGTALAALGHVHSFLHRPRLRCWCQI
mmetsp:Transcript_66610/g.205963  ORF Transcript_66610/g.205963 Transcript_66610/m.205963 type:complete len:229 (+) Transcript_66610:302-988(+)